MLLRGSDGLRRRRRQGRPARAHLTQGETQTQSTTDGPGPARRGHGGRIEYAASLVPWVHEGGHFAVLESGRVRGPRGRGQLDGATHAVVEG